MYEYKWHTILFLVLLVIIQPFTTEWFDIKGVSINFLLFFIMMTAFGKKNSKAVITALCLGVAYDMIYSPWIGKMTLVFLLAIATVFLVNKIVYKENVPVLTVYFFATVYFLENIVTVLELGVLKYIESFGFIQKEILKISIYAAVLTMIIGIWFYIQSFLKDKKLRTRKG